MKIINHQSLQAFTTLALPYSTKAFVRVTNIDELRQAISYAREQSYPILILGGGSNIILTQDFQGLCIHLCCKGIVNEIKDEDWVSITAQAGENWHSFVETCLDQGGYGLENLALIPGTVGAAPIQNIGAYGVEIKDYMFSLEVMDIETLELKRFSNAECQFGYRNSCFKGELKDRFVITSVTFRLRRKPKLMKEYRELAQCLSEHREPTPKDLFAAVVDIRSRKLPDPLVLANVGSFFKNPVISQEQYLRLKERFPTIASYPDGQGVKVAAGWLIDHAGWKGHREEHVGVHQQQALVLVNYGNATAEELVGLASRIQQDVQEKYGVELEVEPRLY